MPLSGIVSEIAFGSTLHCDETSFVLMFSPKRLSRGKCGHWECAQLSAAEVRGGKSLCSTQQIFKMFSVLFCSQNDAG